MIIFDEKIYAEQMLKQGFKTKNKNIYELNILSKYYFYNGLDESKVKQKIIKFCEKFIEHFTLDEWHKIINNTIKAARRGTLKTGKEVQITQKELDVIQGIDGIREQKVAFTLLVLYKFYNYSKFTVVLEDLYALSEITTINYQTKLNILFELTKAGLIDIDMRGRRWIKFADKKAKPIITIRNFDNFIWEYLHYIGEQGFKRCSECNKVIKVTTSNNYYCGICAKEINKRKTLMKYHKNKFLKREHC